MTARRRLILFAAAGGAMTSLCWLPLGLAPFLPLALLLVMRGLRLVEKTRDAVLLGVVFSVVRVAVGGHYILSLMTFSALAPVLLALDMAYYLPFDVLLVWGSFWIERRSGFPRKIAFTLLYVAMEWARTKGDLSNCSDALAHAFGIQPQWLAWSAWTGPFFVSLLALSAAALLDTAIERRRTPARAVAATMAAAILWFAPPLTDAFVTRDESGAAGSLRVGIVQPCISVQDKLDPQRWPVISDRLERLSREAAQGADLVVWPETTRPGKVIWKVDEPFSDPPMEALAKRIGVPILYGCEIARVADGQVVGLLNAAALARPDGSPGEWYAKQQLLPFVEGVPFARWIGWDPAKAWREHRGKRSALTLFGNFTAGARPTVFEVGPAKIGVLICYEGLYPELVRRYRLAGANSLLVMTNDAWWGRSVFARWHARMVSSRAREADVPVVRAANSGVSSITDRFGRMGAATDLFQETTLHVVLRPSGSPPTFYERSGDVLVWADWAGIVFLVAMGLLRRRLWGTKSSSAPSA